MARGISSTNVMSGMKRLRIVIASRCSWTLHNFRLPLILATAAQGHQVTAIGSGGDGYDARLLAAGVDFQPVPVSRRGLAPLMDFLLLFRLIVFFRRTRP